jgi:twitching motility protein PilT
VALFQSEKKVLLNRVQKHDWNTMDDLQEIFTQLNAQELKISDIFWMLCAPDRMVRSYASKYVVSKQLDGTVNAIFKGIKDTQGVGRSHLIQILPQLDQSEEILAHVDKMLADKDEDVAESAVDVVLAFPHESVSRYLQDLLTHPRREFRFRALHRLTGPTDSAEPIAAPIRAMLLPMLEDSDERIRNHCISALAQQPDLDLVKRLIERLPTEEYNVQKTIIRHFETFMPNPELKMVDQLLPLLSQGDDMLRSMALSLSVKHSDPKDIIRRILIMSNELMGWMRERILRTIREFGDDLIIPVAELFSHEDPDVRLKALIFAADFESPELVKPTIKFLSDENWWARIIAMDLLGRLGDEDAVQPLIECLEDEEVRWSAVEALSRIGSEAALGPIVKLLGDKTPQVRMQVIAALELYNDARTLSMLKKSMEKDPEVEVRERALQAYRNISAKHEREINEKELRASFGYGQTTRQIDKLLTETRRIGASDFHITPGSLPIVRWNGELKRTGKQAFTAKQTEDMLVNMLEPHQRERFDKEHQLDFCYVIPSVGRYRANIYRQRLGCAGVFRVIPNELPSFTEVGLPEHLVDLTSYHQGLIIITGPAGSGKSTTLAAMVNLINEKKREHVLTLEDPIEFVHPYKNSLINQREIGKHTKSFASALRAALREDPDVIVVGELRDQETITLALTAAETGHLVISTMNTTSAIKTIDRLVDAFPPKEQSAIRMMLSESIAFITTQSLLPRADKKGQVACFEVLMITGPVQNLIRDNKTGQIPSAMIVGREQGMQTVDLALQNLLNQQRITPETAYLRAEKKETFEAMCSPEFLDGREFE